MDVTFLYLLPQNVALNCNKICLLTARWAGFIHNREENSALSTPPPHQQQLLRFSSLAWLAEMAVTG